MVKKILNYLHDIRNYHRIGIALSKGFGTKNARELNLILPHSWEFSGFSQNGEDGIIETLRKQLLASNRYFIEIGSADGIENNSAWLTVAEKYSGIMIDGDKKLMEHAKRTISRYSIGVECVNMFVNREEIKTLKKISMYSDPDVFSLDIDGNDYYIAQAIFDEGFRPKIFVVEYNSVFGPEKSLTIEYDKNFIFSKAHESQLYYGVSISGWKKFFEERGYKFITVDQNGVNAFFVDPQYFDSSFLAEIKGIPYAENLYQYRKFKKKSEEQFELISDEKFVLI